MAADGPETKSEKVVVNLSTAYPALDHYVAITTVGELAGVEQLFAEDFSQKIHSANAKTHHREEIVKFFKKEEGKPYFLVFMSITSV